jgi:hypothetical protein
MTAYKDLLKYMKQNHVVSFRLKYTNAWAGYSPANGKFWVMGKSYETAEEAAYEMSLYGIDRWEFIDMCIDEE